MKKRIAGIGVVAVVGLVAQMALASMSMEGCSADDAAADASDGAAASDAFFDPCSLFTDAGDPCTVKTAVACFPECDFGGCFCLETPGGGGGKRWSCTTDLSCFADSAPINDDMNAPDAIVTPDDAGDDDASDDAGDAGASSDASDGAISDAGVGDANDGAIGDADAAD